MPVTALTVAPQSQAVASLEIISGATSATITNVVLKNRTGPNQVAVLTMDVDGDVLELTLVLYDEAFQDVDLFGGKKNQGSGEGEAGMSARI